MHARRITKLVYSSSLMAVCLHSDGSCSPHHRITKLVYSSSLMEASFFTIKQRLEIERAEEEEARSEKIERLNKVGREGEGERGRGGKSKSLASSPNPWTRS